MKKEVTNELEKNDEQKSDKVTDSKHMDRSYVKMKPKLFLNKKVSLKKRPPKPSTATKTKWLTFNV